MDSLMHQAVPGITFFVFERSIPKSAPFLEENCGRVLSAEISAEGSFKATAEDHRCARIFFPPAIQIAVAIAARATKVLTNLRVAVGHRNLLSARLHEHPSRSVPIRWKAQTRRDLSKCDRQTLFWGFAELR